MMNRRLLLLAILLALALPAFGQTDRLIDSLRRVLRTSENDTLRSRTYINLIQQLNAAGRAAEGERTARQSLAYARSIGYPFGEAASLQLLANSLMERSQVDSAVMYARQGCDVFREAGSGRHLAESLSRLGFILRINGKTAEAVRVSEEAYRVFISLGLIADATGTMMTIAILKSEEGALGEGVKAFGEVYKLYRSLKDTAGMSLALQNMGVTEGYAGNERQAMNYYRQSLALLDACNCAPDQKMGALFNMASSYSAMGKNQDAYRYARESYVIAQRNNNWGFASKIAMLLADLNHANGNRDSTEFYLNAAQWAATRSDEQRVLADMFLARGRYAARARAYADAQGYFRAADSIYQAIAFIDGKKSLAHERYLLDSTMGNFRAALEHYKQYRAWDDSMRSADSQREMGRMEARLQADKELELEHEQRRIERERSAWALGSAGGGLLLLGGLAFVLFRGRRKEKRANDALRALNEQINAQKAEIEDSNAEILAINDELHATLHEVTRQRNELQDQREKIDDSIRYAARIQRAILPDDNLLSQTIPPHFVFYEPRDVVSGDFYWFAQAGGQTFLAVADCTGHGVPGAFMSVLGANLLRQIVEENHIHEPDVILAELDRRIVLTLRQERGGDSKDGLDVALLALGAPAPDGARTLRYAGAGRPLWILTNNEIAEYKSAKYACGGSQHEDKTYPAVDIALRPGDRVYAFSDGVTDQFGGPQGRKLGSRGLQAFLLETAALPPSGQGAAFTRFFAEWKGARKQLDDALLIGLSV